MGLYKLRVKFVHGIIEKRQQFSDGGRRSVYLHESGKRDSLEQNNPDITLV